MKIGVVLPTRGLVFTEVEKSIEQERQLKECEVRVFRSSNLPIPDGHNQLTKEALDWGADYIWFIEEDTVSPTGALEKLVQTNSELVCIDYGVSGWSCITKNSKGEILWCGLGCTLVKREVLEKMDYPYFRTDKTLRLNDWTWQDLPEDYIKNKNYGSLDIWFFTQARKLGFEIKQVDGECDHLQLESLGEKGKNNGIHNIITRPKITKNQILEEGGGSI